MRYRYTVRASDRAVLSRHQNYLGALDAVAGLRAAATREGRESPEYVYDERLKRVVSPPDPNVGGGALQVALTLAERARLREVAAEVGALARSGRWAGAPSINALLKGIGSGELLVRRRDPDRPAGS